MSKTVEIDAETEKLLAPVQAGDCSPEHDAWIKAQVEKTRREAHAHPEKMIPLETIRRKFGL